MNVIHPYNKKVESRLYKRGIRDEKTISPRPQGAQELEGKDSKQIRTSSVITTAIKSCLGTKE